MQISPGLKATLSGCKRAWRFYIPQNTYFLTLIPDRTSTIDGLLASVQPNWKTLDLREAAYDRFECRDLFQTQAKKAFKVSAYAVPAPLKIGTNTAKPVLLSCLEPVIEGLLTVYDLDGVTHFIDTTTG
jgi:hypothetical protein